MNGDVQSIVDLWKRYASVMFTSSAPQKDVIMFLFRLAFIPGISKAWIRPKGNENAVMLLVRHHSLQLRQMRDNSH
jgi:hypothetical protein